MTNLSLTQPQTNPQKKLPTPRVTPRTSPLPSPRPSPEPTPRPTPRKRSSDPSSTNTSPRRLSDVAAAGSSSDMEPIEVVHPPILVSENGREEKKGRLTLCDYSHPGVYIVASDEDAGARALDILMRRCHLPVCAAVVGGPVTLADARDMIRERDTKECGCPECGEKARLMSVSRYRQQLALNPPKATNAQLATPPPPQSEFSFLMCIGCSVPDSVAKQLGPRLVRSLNVEGMMPAILEYLNVHCDSKSAFRQRVSQWVVWTRLSGLDNGSSLCVWHRPSKGQLQPLKEEGCTMVITLQAEKEKACDVGKATKKLGMKWLWVPLDGANQAILQNKRTRNLIMQGVIEAVDELKGGGRIMIHCAAGVHRTGVFGYMILRMTGLSREEALVTLWKTRPETGRGVGDHRIEYAEKLIGRLAKQSTSQNDTPDSTPGASPRDDESEEEDDVAPDAPEEEGGTPVVGETSDGQ